MEKMYQVFVSSTYEDLRIERQSVTLALLKNDFIPAGMELLFAQDDSQWDVIKKCIGESDFYVVILAGRYGTCHSSGKSFTQMEYEFAKAANLRIIRLLLDNEVYTKLERGKFEEDTKKKKSLEDFRKRISTSKMCDFWKNMDDLCVGLITALNKELKKSRSGGWLRDDAANRKEIIDESLTIHMERSRQLQLEVDGLKVERSSLHAQVECLKGKIDQDENIYEAFMKRSEEIDNELNSDNNIHNSKSRDPANFKIKVIIESLHQLGIPLDVSLEVCKIAVNEFRIIKSRSESITTNIIRLVITNSIFRLDSKKYTENQIENWADIYTKKFGKPDTRYFLINDRPGEFQYNRIPLTYKYLREHFVKNLIEDLLGSGSYDLLQSARLINNLERISHHLMKRVKALDVSELKYSTLLGIGKDLALQTPHPWILTTSNRSRLHIYDIEKAVNHANNILLKSSLYHVNYVLSECIHHSSSGLLSMYREYLGCEFLSPFFGLQNLVNYQFTGCLRTDSNLLINRLSRGLSQIGYNVSDFNHCLNTIKIYVDTRKQRDITYEDVDVVTPILTLFVIFARIFILENPDRLNVIKSQSVVYELFKNHSLTLIST